MFAKILFIALITYVSAQSSCSALDAVTGRNEQGFHISWTDSECQSFCGTNAFNAGQCGRGCGSRCGGCACNTCAPRQGRRSPRRASNDVTKTTPTNATETAPDLAQMAALAINELVLTCKTNPQV